jgi:hypothetical protein
MGDTRITLIRPLLSALELFITSYANYESVRTAAIINCFVDSLLLSPIMATFLQTFRG